MTGEAAVDRVLRAIRALPREQAQMLLHRFHHHRTDAEIAGEMQLPETQVASSIAAAMQQVAALVKAMQ